MVALSVAISSSTPTGSIRSTAKISGTSDMQRLLSCTLCQR